ncbi:hypothetical protein [Streptomyces sp. NPDC058620]|uniref:hypothetical protein n=1 Tax=Streptomyces sp. NPDC058620 TaxID=3346560 RepID=UPI0036525437
MSHWAAGGDTARPLVCGPGESRPRGVSTRTDADPLRATALPLHTAVFDAFTAEGYGCTTTRTVDSTIPDTEFSIYLRQSFLLTRGSGHEGRRSWN